MAETRDVPINEIVEPAVLLRLVDRQSVDYLELRDSIAEKGVLNSVCVRPSARRPGKYEIVDGFHRYTAAKECGLLSLPCIIRDDLTDADVLVAQVQTNSIRPETKPVEFARHLKRILLSHGDMTLNELSGLVGKSPNWVRNHLGLLRLRQVYQRLVDSEMIPLTNAMHLSRLPAQLQDRLLKYAQNEDNRTFSEMVGLEIKHFTEAIRSGRLEDYYRSLEKFRPHPYLRSMQAINRELELQVDGPLVVAAENAATPLEGFYVGLRWVLNMDRRSINERREKHNSKSRKKVSPTDLEQQI